MKSKLYILYIYLVCTAFITCQIPVSLWHQHDLEVCVDPTHIHDEPEHACLVATVLPHSHLKNICKHSQHISSEKEHCQLCKFEVAKYLETEYTKLSYSTVYIYSFFREHIPFLSKRDLLRASNKGPPLS